GPVVIGSATPGECFAVELISDQGPGLVPGPWGSPPSAIIPGTNRLKDCSTSGQTRYTPSGTAAPTSSPALLPPTTGRRRPASGGNRCYGKGLCHHSGSPKRSRTKASGDSPGGRRFSWHRICLLPPPERTGRSEAAGHGENRA